MGLLMPDYPVSRLLIGFGVMILGFVAMDVISTEELALSFIFSGLVVTVHRLCRDVLDYIFLDSAVAEKIKRALFVASGVGAILLSFTPLFDVSVDFNTLNYFKTAHFVSLTPAVCTAIPFCHLTLYYNMKRQHTCFISIVTFDPDVKISGGTFQNQAVVDRAIGAKDSYIKSLMDSIRRDAADCTIRSAKYIGCDSAIHISFDVNF